MMLHKEDTKSDLATNMFNLEQKQVVFVPQRLAVIPVSRILPITCLLIMSYGHVPPSVTRTSGRRPRQTSREFFKKAAHPQS